MTKLLSVSAVAALFLGGAPMVAAQLNTQNTDQDSANRLERVIVTASRVEELTTQRAVATIVLDREQIQQQNARDLGEILRYHAGIDVGRNGGPGQTTSLFVRGAESNHVLVLVNGVRINPGTIGVSAIQNIDPDLVERIEVVKGPRSSVYGSDAIGGVVNVITRSPTNTNRTTFSVGAGSFDTRDINGQYSLGGQDQGGSVGVSWHDTEGFATRADASDDHGHDNVSVTGSYWRALGNHRIELDLWHSSGNTEYAGFPATTTVDQDFENQSIQGTLISNMSDTWTSRLNIAHTTDDIQQNQPPFPGADEDFLTTDRLSMDWQNTLTLANDHRLVAGISAYSEDVDVLSFGTPFDEGTNVIEAYTEYGLNGEQYDASLAARYTNHDDFGTAVTWHADVAWSLNPQWQVTLAAGTGFRAPDATDRFGFGGNQELDAEESLTYELGLRYTLSAQHAFELRAFDQQIDNLINFVVISFDPFEGINQNVDETRTQGVEFSHKYVNNRLRIETDITSQSPEDEATGQTLLRRAEQILTTNAYYQFGQSTVGLNVLAAGERPDIDAITFGRTTNPGYVLGGLSYSYKLPSDWIVRAKIENLLDTTYQTANGFNQAERSYYLEFTYSQ